MLVIKAKQQIGTPEYMNIAYLDRQVCSLFGVQPDDDLCAAPKIITEYKPKDIRELAQKIEIRIFWAWDRFTLYILNKVYEQGIVPKGGYVTSAQLVQTTKKLFQNTRLNPSLNHELCRLYTWFQSRDYLLKLI